jgi:peptide-methionine (R)-S-oxide reductase
MTRRLLLNLLSGLGLASPAAQAASTPTRPDAAHAERCAVEAAPDAGSSTTCCATKAPNAPAPARLNGEKRKGRFLCAGCDLPLFDASTKYESGTGWPSFYDPLPGAVATKTDFKIAAAAHRVPLRALRRPPGPCVRRRPQADRQALLQQRRGPAFRGGGMKAAAWLLALAGAGRWPRRWRPRPTRRRHRHLRRRLLLVRGSRLRQGAGGAGNGVGLQRRQPSTTRPTSRCRPSRTGHAEVVRITL